MRELLALIVLVIWGAFWFLVCAVLYRIAFGSC